MWCAAGPARELRGPPHPRHSEPSPEASSCPLSGHTGQLRGALRCNELPPSIGHRPAQVGAGKREGPLPPRPWPSEASSRAEEQNTIPPRHQGPSRSTRLWPTAVQAAEEPPECRKPEARRAGDERELPSAHGPSGQASHGETRPTGAGRAAGRGPLLRPDPETSRTSGRQEQRRATTKPTASSPPGQTGKASMPTGQPFPGGDMDRPALRCSVRHQALGGEGVLYHAMRDYTKDARLNLYSKYL